MSRQQVRQIINEIARFNVFTQFFVKDGKLVLKTEEGVLTRTQLLLAREHNKEISEYITTPPDVTGECSRCKHHIRWVCTQYGAWVCDCYFNEEALRDLASKPKRKSKIANHWLY